MMVAAGRAAAAGFARGDAGGFFRRAAVRVDVFFVGREGIGLHL